MSPGVTLPTLGEAPLQNKDLLLGALHQPVIGDVDAGMHKLQDVTTPPMGSPQHAETPGAPQEVSPSERAAQHRLAVSAAVNNSGAGSADLSAVLPAPSSVGSAESGSLGKRKRLDSSSKSLLVPSPLQHSTDADEAARALKIPRAADGMVADSAAAAAAVIGAAVAMPTIPIIPEDGAAAVPAAREFVPTMSMRAVNASKQKKAEAAAAAEAASQAAAAAAAAAAPAPQATRSVYDQETTYDQHNRKIYRCRTCSRTFTHPPAFAQHKRSHEREAGGYNASASHHNAVQPRERSHSHRTAGHRTAGGAYAGAAAEWDVAGIADTRVHDDGVREWLVDWSHKYGNKHRQRSWEMLWAFVSLQGVNSFLLDFEYKRTGINNDVDALVKFCKSHGVL